MDPSTFTTTREGAPVYAAAQHMSVKSILSGTALVAKATFDTVCPRGTPQRFLATKVIPVTAGVVTVVSTCNAIGHRVAKSLDGGEEKHNAEFSHHAGTYANAVGSYAVETLMGALTIIFGGAVSGLTIGGSIAAVRGISNAYSKWRQKELRDIDLESGKRAAAVEHKST